MTSSQVRLDLRSSQSFVDSLSETSQRENCAVVIDSLSSLLLHQCTAAVCRTIRALSKSLQLYQNQATLADLHAIMVYIFYVAEAKLPFILYVAAFHIHCIIIP